ncbi:two-component sensor histidine kinase [Agrobacterium vitis]|nr:two-component sensor histidine kinase [Agrobacterium vitis]MCM2470091.1 two-component sensor histidine kinase [Agrobacterium vitis]MUO73003.1 two-component sensor histidine kinase [Agrobacterium vitis]MUO86816.1 two-component sensor histidine kinase [Agrobacterium vitis]MVA35332.1 two-component sensor histidine kinase [Agrobacterium vitis]
MVSKEDRKSRKFGVLVLSKIADRAKTLLDEAVTLVVTRIGAEASPSRAEVAAARCVVLACLPALVLVPFILSFFQGVAVALPLGVAIVAGLFLIAIVAALWLARLSGRQPVIRNSLDTSASIDLSLFPGMVFTLDAQARVETVGGRDARDFLPFLRNPLGRPFIDQVHVTDRIAFVRAFDALRQGEDVGRVQLRLARPTGHPEGVKGETGEGQYSDTASDEAADGTLMAVGLDMAVRRDERGGIAGIFVQMLDCREQQQMAQRLVKLDADLQTANEAKSRFLAAVSHELRTPLNAILGFSDILMGDYFGRMEDERHREYVRLIRQSGGHLLSVVNTMLDMCRIEAGRYELLVEPFCISQTIHDCENMLALQAQEKGVKLTSRIGRDVSELTADPRAVRQILINLVGNAIKFTQPGGVVTVDAARFGKDLVISVSDTGIGIAQDRILLLGQPFVQVDSDYNRKFDGVGLGLSLVKGLVALHGGTFLLTSRVGEGTVVSITLPIDGSGIARVQSTGESRQIEFPPRLPVSDRQPAREKLDGPMGENLADDRMGLAQSLRQHQMDEVSFEEGAEQTHERQGSGQPGQRMGQQKDVNDDAKAKIA